MYTENISKCPYFGGSFSGGDVCRMTDIPIEDIHSSDGIVCLREHYYICLIYRNYNEDFIEA